MAGTIEGGRKAAATNKRLYGPDFYDLIGRAGGTKSRGGGFTKNSTLAREAGRKGGQRSSRSLLDADKVAEMRYLREVKKWKLHELGTKYHITLAHAGRIVRYLSWVD